jgi:hypothetical protein
MRMSSGPQRVMARLAEQDLTDWNDLVDAQLSLLIAQYLVWTRPKGRFVKDAQLDSPGVQEPVSLRSEMWRNAFRAAVAIRRVADHSWLKPRCLVRAVALSRMLEKRGITGSRVRVGVKQRAGEFSAHAWVELGQRVLGDDAHHVQSFAELVDLQVV